MDFKIEDISVGDLPLLDSLNEEYPGCTFSVTPAIYYPESEEIRRGIMVRLPNGELRKLKKSLNREQTQDAVINDAAAAEEFETAVMNELRSAIRKEMKSIL
jgi:hypothetical protein